VQDEFKALRRGVLDRATLRLTHSIDAAIDVLIEISQDKIQPAAPRAQCAIQLIKAAYQGAGLADIEERISQLESRSNNNSGHTIDQKPEWNNV
jgi:hypothetical protein